MKFALKTIWNFVKFTIISGILICSCIVISIKADINPDISYIVIIALIALISLLTGIFAYRKRYFRFEKGNMKQNIASIIFILTGIWWVTFVTRWCIALGYVFTVSYYMG